MYANYFFIDGSALTAQIRQLQRAEPTFRGRKLCPKKFVGHLMRSLLELHGGEYKRAIFYFPKGDETSIEEYLDMPDLKKPGDVRDIHFKFCGEKLKKSSEFEKFVEENVPSHFSDRFGKSEKGIDIEMCCDGLKLASAARVERQFLLSNDRDFIPFCRTIKEFGANISIIHLSKFVNPNLGLLKEADSYDVVSLEDLHSLFLPLPEATQGESVALEETAAEPAATPSVDEATEDTDKPDTEPSDLDMVEDEPPADPKQTSEPDESKSQSDD